jgi:hypothetical protein
VDGGIDGAGGSGGGPGAVIRWVRQRIVVCLLRAVIGRRGVAVSPGMDSMQGPRGDEEEEGWRRVGGGERTVVVQIDGMTS